MKTRLTTLLGLLIVTILASACRSAGNAPQGEAVSVLTKEEASTMIDSACKLSTPVIMLPGAGIGIRI